MNMASALLGIAGILEVAFAYSMKSSKGLTQLIPGLLPVAAGVSSVFPLSLSLRTLPVEDRLRGPDRHRHRGRGNPGNGGARRFRPTTPAIRTMQRNLQ
jgi:hypothetical protein